MPDQKFSNYKASTLLRALCYIGLGYQVSLMLQSNNFAAEGFVFIAIYAFGLFVSKAKDKTQMLAFGILAFLAGAMRAFFQWDGYSGQRVLLAPGKPAGGSTGASGKPAGFNFTGFEAVSVADWVQFLMSVGLAFFAYTIYKP